MYYNEYILVDSSIFTFKIEVVYVFISFLLLDGGKINKRKSYKPYNYTIYTMENRQLLQEIREIKKDVKTIMENMPDKDMFLTTEEEILLEQSYLNEKNKQLISSHDLRKQLSI